MMRKYGITDADIERPEMRRFEYKYRFTKRKFALQLFAHVTGRNQYIDIGNGLMFALEMTHSEFIEFNLKMNFFWRAYQRDLQDFYTAFIMKNKLFRETAEPISLNDLTPEERAEYERASKMATALTKHELQNQITSAAKRIGN